MLNDSVLKTLQKYVIVIFICSLLEGTIVCLFIPFKEKLETSIIAFSSSVIVLVIICGVTSLISKVGNVLDYKNDKYVKYYTVLYAVSVSAIIVDYNLKGTYLSVYIVGILASILITYILQLVLWRTRAEMEIKKLETELHEIYGSTYTELLSRVRRRQHDFNNQLSAIYGMHLTANSLEELVERQREYTDRLLEDCKYEDILTKCENPILAGYLYNNCLKAESVGVNIEYDIHIEQAKCIIRLHELVEIIGILLNNASESMEESKMKPSVIHLILCENEEGIFLSVANPSMYISFQQINYMFMEGASTKGKERGIGLARAKEIANAYSIEIRVSNCEQEEINWICFEIEIPKEK